MQTVTVFSFVYIKCYITVHFLCFSSNFFCEISHLTVASNRTVQDFYVFLKSLIAIHFLLPCKPDLIFNILYFFNIIFPFNQRTFILQQV